MMNGRLNNDIIEYSQGSHLNDTIKEFLTDNVFY